MRTNTNKLIKMVLYKRPTGLHKIVALNFLILLSHGVSKKECSILKRQQNNCLLNIFLFILLFTDHCFLLHLNII